MLIEIGWLNLVRLNLAPHVDVYAMYLYSSDESVESIEARLDMFAVNPHKKYAIFAEIDDEKPLQQYANKENVFIFRTSMQWSLRAKNEFLLPISHGHWPSRALITVNKTSKPKIAFCGMLSHPIRAECVASLQKTSAIETHFVIREVYWGGSLGNPYLMAEFLANMDTAEFHLCVRGAGNFSARFYEALANGRIPVYICTDSVLPFASLIDWESFIVIAKSVEDVPDAILRFWNTRDIEVAQKQCRNLSMTHFLDFARFAQNIQDQMALDVPDLFPAKTTALKVLKLEEEKKDEQGFIAESLDMIFADLTEIELFPLFQRLRIGGCLVMKQKDQQFLEHMGDKIQIVAESLNEIIIRKVQPLRKRTPIDYFSCC